MCQTMYARSPSAAPNMHRVWTGMFGSIWRLYGLGLELSESMITDITDNMRRHGRSIFVAFCVAFTVMMIMRVRPVGFLVLGVCANAFLIVVTPSRLGRSILLSALLMTIAYAVTFEYYNGWVGCIPNP